MSVSTDARFVACADASGQVLLYGILPHKGAYYKWDLVGKFKAHHSESFKTCVICLCVPGAAMVTANTAPSVALASGNRPLQAAGASPWQHACTCTSVHVKHNGPCC